MSQACLHMLALRDSGGASWRFYSDPHLCSSCQHKVLGTNVLRAEHSTSVTQMNVQPTLLFTMQGEHRPDSPAELKHCKLQPVVSTE